MPNTHADLEAAVNSAIQAARADWDEWAADVWASCRWTPGADVLAIAAASKGELVRRDAVVWANEAFDIALTTPAEEIAAEGIAKLRQRLAAAPERQAAPSRPPLSQSV